MVDHFKEAREEQSTILKGETEVSLQSIGRSKASGTGGIPMELFQALGDDAVEVLMGMCQRIYTIR